MEGLSAKQKQLEENKRKYIAQQQSTLKTPALSVQKANLIKAKLGLAVATQSWTKGNSSRSLSIDTRQNGQAQQASTNNPVTTDPTGSPLRDNDGSDLAAQSGLLIGAPLNSIPKTDFECTDKKGRFVAGLFADQKTGCQVWHLCSSNRKYSFLCPSGTIFNAKLRICDWRYNVKCESSLPF